MLYAQHKDWHPRPNNNAFPRTFHQFHRRHRPSSVEVHALLDWKGCGPIVHARWLTQPMLLLLLSLKTHPHLWVRFLPHTGLKPPHNPQLCSTQLRWLPVYDWFLQLIPFTPHDYNRLRAWNPLAAMIMCVVGILLVTRENQSFCFIQHFLWCHELQTSNGEVFVPLWKYDRPKVQSNVQLWDNYLCSLNCWSRLSIQHPPVRLKIDHVLPQLLFMSGLCHWPISQMYFGFVSVHYPIESSLLLLRLSLIEDLMITKPLYLLYGFSTSHRESNTLFHPNLLIPNRHVNELRAIDLSSNFETNRPLGGKGFSAVVWITVVTTASISLPQMHLKTKQTIGHADSVRNQTLHLRKQCLCCRYTYKYIFSHLYSIEQKNVFYSVFFKHERTLL